MREGLRSGKLRVRQERDDILSEKKLEEEDTPKAVNLDGGEALVLGTGDQEVVVPSGQGYIDVGEERPEVSKVKFRRLSLVNLTMGKRSGVKP
ncbi:hypothetical protein MLD38_031823 [Melastoma candidum]|uniref:Uncharacterized protein n=1 Tax=Melastoma candidum TaxID=119954 RepID=A0ACB9MS12_9MYRT|nr:hypothetical protein MLD38_031823 [Melastoma candidum]